MGEWLPGAATALWLGTLTSLSPCPLATNIAAISFVGRRVGRPRLVLLAGFLYTLGRSLTYVVLGALLVSSILSAPQMSHALQEYMNKIIGPILILVGMFLLEMLSINLSGSGIGESMQRRIETWGVWGAGVLGIFFALSFCPVSAALFFGSLVPMAVMRGSGVLLPSLYGVGTGLPVLLFALLIALGTGSVGRMFNRLSQIERWARRVTGIIFIVVGIYYSLVHIFGLFY